MRDSEKVTFINTITGEQLSNTVADVYLTLAKQQILDKRYPFGVPENMDIPSQYEILQCQLAARLYLKRGAEGEIVHNENGINRSYGSVDEDDLLARVVPIAKVV